MAMLHCCFGILLFKTSKMVYFVAYSMLRMFRDFSMQSLPHKDYLLTYLHVLNTYF